MKCILINLVLVVIVSCNTNKHFQKTDRNVSYIGGKGKSIKDAIIIKYANSSKILLKAEKDFLIKEYGLNKKCEILKKHYIINDKIDVFEMKVLSKDSLFSVYFDLQYFVE